MAKMAAHSTSTVPVPLRMIQPDRCYYLIIAKALYLETGRHGDYRDSVLVLSLEGFFYL
jgi:hypothetical protein